MQDKQEMGVVTCIACGSENLLDLGPGEVDAHRHMLLCRDSGHFFEYPPREDAVPGSPGASEGHPLTQVAALDEFGDTQRLEEACRTLADALRALRRGAAECQATRGLFNEVCWALEEWVEVEVANLRFPME